MALSLKSFTSQIIKTLESAALHRKLKTLPKAIIPNFTWHYTSDVQTAVCQRPTSSIEKSRAKVVLKRSWNFLSGSADTITIGLSARLPFHSSFCLECYNSKRYITMCGIRKNDSSFRWGGYATVCTLWNNELNTFYMTHCRLLCFHTYQ